MNAIAAKRDRIGDLIGMFVNVHMDACFGEFRHHEFIELGYRPWLQSYTAFPAFTCHNLQDVPIEVEDDLQCPVFVIDGRSRETACIYIQGDMPGVIEPGRES